MATRPTGLESNSQAPINHAPAHVGQPIAFDVAVPERGDHPLGRGQRGDDEYPDELRRAAGAAGRVFAGPVRCSPTWRRPRSRADEGGSSRWSPEVIQARGQRSQAAVLVHVCDRHRGEARAQRRHQLGGHQRAAAAAAKKSVSAVMATGPSCSAQRAASHAAVPLNDGSVAPGVPCGGQGRALRSILPDPRCGISSRTTTSGARPSGNCSAT